MSKDIEPRTPFERRALIFIAIVSAISLLAIAGWLFNLPVLTSLRPEFIPMAPSTAVIFLGLSCTGLVYRSYSARRGMRILVQAGLLAMLTIVFILAFRYFAGLGPDLEQMLIPNPSLLGEIETARISPLTALGFFLTIPAFLLLTGREPGRRTKSASAALSLAVLLLSSLIILGYLYGVPLFYGGTLIPVAVTTALSFLFLSLGLLMGAGPACWPVRMFVGPSLKAGLMRAILPVSVGIVLLQGLFSTALTPWIVNPALRVALAALAACFVLIFIISRIAHHLSAEIERADRARKLAESTLIQSETRFRSLVETASDAIINIDHTGRVVFWNRAAEIIFGYSAEEVTGQQLDMVMPEKLQTAHHQGLERFLSTRESHILGRTVELVGLRKDGREFPLALSLATWQVGEDIFFTGIGRDISAQRLVEEALRKSESSLHAILRSTADGILAIGIENEVLYTNERFADIWHIPPEVMESQNDSILLQHVLDQLSDPQNFLETVQELYGSQNESFDTLNFKDGRVFERLSRPLMEGEAVLGRVWSFRDITGRMRLEEEIRSLSLTDELTGLYNRRGFTLLAEQEVKLAHREKRPLLLLFSDVDNLKMINDNWGHASGDLALKETSAILKESLRESDILGRIGGDEFVALALAVSKDSPAILTNRIQSALEVRNQREDSACHLEFSFGIVYYDPEFPSTLDELIAQADRLMYQQKQARKSTS